MLTTLHNGMATFQKHQDDCLHKQQSIIPSNLTGTTAVSQVHFVHIHSIWSIQAFKWRIGPEFPTSPFKSKLLREDQKPRKWKKTLHNRSYSMLSENAVLQQQGYKLRQALWSLEGITCFKTSDHNFFACTQWWEEMGGWKHYWIHIPVAVTYFPI